jgi:hypothetical protein
MQLTGLIFLGMHAARQAASCAEGCITTPHLTGLAVESPSIVTAAMNAYLRELSKEYEKELKLGPHRRKEADHVNVAKDASANQVSNTRKAKQVEFMLPSPGQSDTLDATVQKRDHFSSRNDANQQREDHYDRMEGREWFRTLPSSFKNQVAAYEKEKLSKSRIARKNLKAQLMHAQQRRLDNKETDESSPSFGLPRRSVELKPKDLSPMGLQGLFRTPILPKLQYGKLDKEFVPSVCTISPTDPDAPDVLPHSALHIQRLSPVQQIGASPVNNLALRSITALSYFPENINMYQMDDSKRTVGTNTEPLIAADPNAEETETVTYDDHQQLVAWFKQKFPHANGSSRKEVLALIRYLDHFVDLANDAALDPKMPLEEKKARRQDLDKVYDIVGNEIIQSVGFRCLERGALLDRVINHWKSGLNEKREQNKENKKYRVEAEKVIRQLESVIAAHDEGLEKMRQTEAAMNEVRMEKYNVSVEMRIALDAQKHAEKSMSILEDDLEARDQTIKTMKENHDKQLKDKAQEFEDLQKVNQKLLSTISKLNDRIWQFEQDLSEGELEMQGVNPSDYVYKPDF